MRIGVLGINHKLAELRLRELLAKACQRRFGTCCTHDQHHTLLLSTCNRTEIYFGSDDLAESHSYILSILRQEVQEDFDQKLYSYFGIDCFLHLCRVTAGLDSAIVGETEIQGQVKTAYEYATEFVSLRSEFHFMFQKALSIGKKVRTEFPMERGLPDLEHAILNMGIQTFQNPYQSKILFVGASEINQKILSFFTTKKMQNITICNRSYKPAWEMAKNYQVHLEDWKSISHWHCFDWIILGTKSPNFIINRESIPANISDRKLIIDLSVPRNVDPVIGRDPRITLMNIDQINRTLSIRRKRMHDILNKAEELVAESTFRHAELFQKKSLQLALA